MLGTGIAIGAAVGLAVGIVAGILIRMASSKKKLGSAEEQARRILEDAIKNAESAKKNYDYLCSLLED